METQKTPLSLVNRQRSPPTATDNDHVTVSDKVNANGPEGSPVLNPIVVFPFNDYPGQTVTLKSIDTPNGIVDSPGQFLTYQYLNTVVPPVRADVTDLSPGALPAPLPIVLSVSEAGSTGHQTPAGSTHQHQLDFGKPTESAQLTTHESPNDVKQHVIQHHLPGEHLLQGLTSTPHCTQPELTTCVVQGLTNTPHCTQPELTTCVVQGLTNTPHCTQPELTTCVKLVPNHLVHATVEVVSQAQCHSQSQISPAKKKGGWPKGRKRKKEILKPPRAPVTGYVLFSTERRQHLRLTNPELSFTEVTRLTGSDWSNLDAIDKQKYTERALLDKKRYIEELRDYQASDEYQNFVKSKRDKYKLSMVTKTDDFCDDDFFESDSLYCRVCDVFFSSVHNRKEHFFGRHHLQNVTNELRQDFQQREEQEREKLLPYSTMSEVPEDREAGLPIAELHTAKTVPDLRPSPGCVCGGIDTLTAEEFMHVFMEKNSERDVELKELQRQVLRQQTKYKDYLQQAQYLKEKESTMMEEWATLKSFGSSLSAQLDALKMVPHLFGLINF